jgi:hypothetical protein
MNNQIVLGELDSAQHLLEEGDTGFQTELEAIAVGVDGFSVDQFHHQKWFAIGRHSAVEQLCDMRMIQAGEDLALGEKPLAMPLPAQRPAQDFDGDVLLELSVIAMGAIDGTHAARAQNEIAHIGSESREDRLGGGRQFGGPDVVTGQQRIQFGTQNRIARAGDVQVLGPAIDRGLRRR